MQTVLQISDFHITIASGSAQDNKVFTNLIHKIKQPYLTNIILVYNGDVIDARDISNRIDSALSDEEKAQLWDIEASKAYAVAKDYFSFESYLIGLLYLPSTSLVSNEYEKQTILNIILLHDLGETEVGDIISQYEHYEKMRIRERAFCEELYLQGTHSGMADLTHQFDLWQDWCEEATTNINVRIAEQILNAIQATHIAT